MRVAKVGAAIVCAVVAVVFLWEAAQWQNSIRELMGMPPVDTAHPFEVGLIALATFAILIALARLFRLTDRFVSTRVNRFVPRRVSRVIGVAVTIVLFWSVISGVLFRAALHVADSLLPAVRCPDRTGDRPADRSLEDRQQRLPARVGRAWTGGTGVHFFGAEPERTCTLLRGRKRSNLFASMSVCESADTPEARAKLALEELKRVGGFERSVLIVVTPTGTGWIDPAAMNSVEYLHSGDVASVALQYSYLTSWLSLLVEPGYGADASRALFKEVYEILDHPAKGRPSETLSAWPEPRRDEFRTVDRPVRGDWRSLCRRVVERAALFEQALEVDDRGPQSRVDRLASSIPRRVIRAVHEPERRACCVGLGSG